MQAGVAVPLRIVGIPDEDTVTGSQADIFRHYGITMEGLTRTALEVLKRSPPSSARTFIVCPGRIAMTHIVAIDQSTSATKAVLFDAAGQVVDRVVREHRQIYPQAGWVEHDAEEIWQNVLAVLRELASRNA